MLRIMSGVPGSGKTHIAKVGRYGVAVSADHFFERLGRFDPSKLSEAHGECFRRCIELLKQQEDVVVDNTSLTAWEISPYVLAAQAFGHAAVVIRVECDPALAFARQTHGVPKLGHDRMVVQFEKRDVMPWWTIETVKGD